MTVYIDSSAGDHVLRNLHSQEALAHRAVFDVGPEELPVEGMGGG